MFGLKKTIKDRRWVFVDGLAWALRWGLRILILLWIGGFVWYIASTPVISAGTKQKADAIVVLTGGDQRITTGLSLLEKNLASVLYISGVHPSTSAEQILAIGSLSPSIYHECVVLGAKARTTYGNAMETAEWAIRNKIHSIWLVTSHYHMKRSLFEFNRAMPEMQILPYAVHSDHNGQLWWWHPKTLSLLFSEYHKYLLTLAREIGP